MFAHLLAWVVIILLGLNGTGTCGMAYSVGDAFEAIGPSGEGLQSGYQMADFMGRMLLDTQLDAQTDAFFDYWQQSIRKFDIQALYQAPYLKEAHNGFRVASFCGRTRPGKYEIRLNSPEAPSGEALVRLGDFGAQFGLKQKQSVVNDKNSFEASIDFQIALKQFTHGALAVWIDGMHQVIDPDNIALLNPPPSGIFNGVKGDARKPIDNYYEFFPAQSCFFDRYVQLKSFIETRKHQGQTYTHAELEMMPRLDAFARDFNHLHSYLLKVKGVMGMALQLKTMDDLNIMDFEADTGRTSFFWRFNTRQGKIIPSNAAGEPDFSREFSLHEIDRYQMKAIVSGKVNLYGVHVDSGETITRIQYQCLPDGAHFDFRVVEMPPPRLGGRAMGVVPLFLVDAIIPSNIDDLANEFVTVMAHGGQGSWMKIDWNESRPVDTTFVLQAHTELLDNRFVNLALRLWGRRIHPDPATIEEAARFWGLFFRTMLPGEAALCREDGAIPTTRPNRH